jgi:hypothetical protein
MMRCLPRYLVSLVVQVLLLMLAMCVLDSGVTAINLAALCTAWNLALIVDWALCRLGPLHHTALMVSLPASILSGLPFVFFGISLSVYWEP